MASPQPDLHVDHPGRPATRASRDDLTISWRPKRVGYAGRTPQPALPIFPMSVINVFRSLVSRGASIPSATRS